ncbi:hypothetical protein TVAG_020930 [Trichomonas vaginalis G3]|uniref:Uncharacterized protein n=1 Tax=Trichomonas vaginalis (strain ATCC PRA-98 / G3) TaxID=412133 RepID=A2DH75_TRIV3|nr:glycoprotein 38 family [Trichomonas vaginalis G3]EAY20148.1 hypothetical protein TVAG_020930 [Trichomonas vaginalis G3]KAI5507615.1 glycoprotein 38 family [Trichomonas vaginalis G3]|eukprot:XP_001581134.1 hypothetical protein [Trichomonas vaginalis G3]
MLFLELSLSLEADRLNTTSVFDDCPILIRRDKNEKIRIIELKKNESICIQGSYIIGSNSTIYMQGAFQEQNEDGNWSWKLSSVIKDPFTLLGSYDSELNDYFDPIGKLTCDDEESCQIKILEVYPSYNYTKVKVDPDGVVTKITRIRRNIFNLKNNASTKLIARKTHTKLNEMLFEDVIETSSVVFAFYQTSKAFQITTNGSNIDYDKLNDANESNYVEFSLNLTEEEESQEEFNKSATITCIDSELIEDDSNKTTFLFPLISGELSASAGVYTVESLTKSNDKLPNWAIALISTGCTIFAIVIVLSVYSFARRRKNQNQSSTPSGVQVFDHANDPRDDSIQEYL